MKHARLVAAVLAVVVAAVLGFDGLSHAEHKGKGKRAPWEQEIDFTKCAERLANTVFECEIFAPPNRDEIAVRGCWRFGDFIPATGQFTAKAILQGVQGGPVFYPDEKCACDYLQPRSRFFCAAATEAPSINFTTTGAVAGVVSRKGKIFVSATNHAGGRGAYVCWKNPDCVDPVE